MSYLSVYLLAHSLVYSWFMVNHGFIYICLKYVIVL